MTKLRPINGHIEPWLEPWIERYIGDEGGSKAELYRAGIKLALLERYPEEFGRILEAERELKELKKTNGGK